MTTTNRILLVEDSPAVAKSLSEGLTREGYDIIWRDSGQAGIDFARDHAPHLIILDVRLPDMSGFDVCRKMRQLRLRQPILMLTVQSDEIDKVLGLEMGADDYMTKPYSLQELRSRVRAMLRRSYGELSTTESDLIHIGDVVIDRGRMQVSRGNESINLTPTEFKLLTYLAQNAGQALSRQQILDAVWGYSVEVESDSTINAHIRRLREKIEHDPSRPTLILTVPGVGYRLNK